MDLVDYAQKAFGAIVSGLGKGHGNEHAYCCKEMEEMVTESNQDISGIRTIEAYRKVAIDDEHADLRHRIANHVCKNKRQP